MLEKMEKAWRCEKLFIGWKKIKVMADPKNGILIKTESEATAKVKKVEDLILASDISVEPRNSESSKSVKLTFTLVIKDAQVVEAFDTEKMKETEVFLEFLSGQSVFLVDRTSKVFLQARSKSTVGLTFGVTGGGGKVGGPGVSLLNKKKSKVKNKK